MDSLYYEVLKALMIDGRTPKRRIASQIRVDPSSVEVRFRKMIYEGVIRRFALYVDSSSLGLERVFASFKGLPESEVRKVESVVAYFTCAEGNTLLEITGRNRNENMRILKSLGEPLKVWVQPPSPNPLPTIDKAILARLSKDPRAKEFELAESLKVSARTIRRHLKHLKSKGIMRIVPILDLSKAQGVMFTVHYRQPEVEKVVPDKPIWQTTKEDWKVMNYFVRDLSEVRKVSEAVMSVDSKASINIETSYDIKVPIWALR